MSSKLKVQELRDELSKRGLDTTGLKPALVARLDEAIASENKSDDAEAKDEEAAPSEIDKNDSKSNGKRKTPPRDGQSVDGSAVKRIKLEDIDKLTVDELKVALTELDLSVAGSKATLKKRLKSALQDSGLGDGEQSADAGEKRVTATKKGRAVLDPNLPEHIKRDYHVLEDDDDIYDAMLNQTNVGGNNNKYYVIQALENDSGNSYQLFTRWGRVGAKGQSKLLGCVSKYEVKLQFESTFQQKTSNHWAHRHTFTSYPGKYTWLEMDYDAEEDKAEKPVDGAKPETKAPRKRLPSKLDPQVQRLISTICNMSMMKQEMAEIGYDARKMPLGKLSKSTILKGYEVLKRIAASLEKGNAYRELEELSSEFYTVIPHDFGFKKMRDFVIKTPQAVKKKLEMVEALGEIEVATKLLEVEKEEEEDPLFTQYQRLHCGIEPVLDSEEADWIKKYVDDTHGETHSHYHLSVEHIFKVVREGEDSRFQPFAGTNNRMLLWHGSRMCNWIGILSQGLRIAPPEAPISGYMFGKGVYFADMVSKSANYCYPGGDKFGLLLLCEVALGDMCELLHSNYRADILPTGKLSTKGLGSVAPDPKQYKVLPDGVIVPMGKPKRDDAIKGSLEYNEYIVYNTNQIRMKYLLMVKFGDPRGW
ncbi:unnamed protein product [Calypogeia fissa]